MTDSTIEAHPGGVDGTVAADLSRTRALFVLGPSGRIRDVNPSACALLGQPAEALRGLALHDFVEPGHRSQLAALDRELRAGRSDHYRTVVSFRPAPPPGAAPTVGRPAGEPRGRPALLRTTRLVDGTVVTVQPVAATPPDGAAADLLTPVEAALLELTAQGLTTAQIAKRLHYSDGNVNYHLAGLGTRFGTNNRTALVSRAYVLGFLRRDAWPPKAARVAPGG